MLSLTAVGGLVLVPLYAFSGAFYSIIRSCSTSMPSTIDVSRWLTLVANSAVVCGVAAGTAVVGGVLLGILIARTDLPGRALIRMAAIVCACVPTYVSAVFVFSVIPAWRLERSAVACGLLCGLMLIPLAIVIMSTAFANSDRELEEQALLDCGYRTVLTRVTIPQTGWAVGVLVAIVFLVVGTDFTISDMLSVRTFAEEIYTQYTLGVNPVGPVLTCLPFLGAVSAALAITQLRYDTRAPRSISGYGERRRIHLGWVRWPLGLVLVGIGVAVLATPVANLLLKIGSLGAFLVASRNLTGELLTSSVLATCGATGATAIGALLAYAAGRQGGLRVPALAAIILLASTPAPVVGTSVIALLNRPGILGWLYDGPAAMGVGYLVRFVPFAALLLIPAVKRVPRELELMAHADGCDGAALHRHVYWPALIKDAGTVWLVMIILCFGEIGTTVLLAPARWTPAAVRAFTLIHFGVYRDLAVLALLSLGCILLPVSVLIVVATRTKARRWWAESY